MKLILCLFLLSCIAACNQPRQSKAHENLTNGSFSKMDIIEKFFNNDNWMAIKGRDTSYFYFSRNNTVAKVYNYQIIKGDSANTLSSEMKIANDTITWNYNNSVPIFLAAADDKKLEWKRHQNPNTAYIFFNKKDSLHINCVHGNEQISLIKTLPLSSFLIRSHYDYLHGTRFSFSDTSFNK